MGTLVKEKKTKVKKNSDANKTNHASLGGIISRDLLSSGSTLLNLACSSSIEGAFAKGHYYFFVGDSQSGKTWFGLTCFAEACENHSFDGYRLIYDAPEHGAMMELGTYFGPKTAARIESPNQNGGSQTIEEFYYNLDDAVEDGRPFIYIQDSMDALASEDETDKFKQKKSAFRRGKNDVAGSYGDGKAKKNSGNLRRYISPLKKMNSILIIINQTRDSLGFGFKDKTRSGGHALTFYAAVEMWSSVVKKLTKTVNGKPRHTGAITKIVLEKNRHTGIRHTVDIPFYHSHGIDDTGSLIDFLVEEKHWKKISGKDGDNKKTDDYKLAAHEFDYEGTRDGLVQLIESKNIEDELQTIAASTWGRIEAGMRVQRKKKYQ